MTWLDLWNVEGNKNIDEQIKEKKKGGIITGKNSY